jgi:hypothetical protein
MRLIFTAALLALALAVPGAAAEFYHLRWTGPIDRGTDTTNYFGLGSDLTGATVAVDYAFDMGVGDGCCDPNSYLHYGYGDYYNNPDPLRSPGRVTVTINGISYWRLGNTYSEYFRDLDRDAGTVNTQVLVWDIDYSGQDGSTLGFQYRASDIPPGTGMFDPFSITQVFGGNVSAQRDDGHMGRYAQFYFEFGGQANAFSLTRAVPEPASWALMIAGFGMTGAALRRRRAAVVAG